MFLLGNLANGNKELRTLVRTNFDLIKVINDIIQTEKSLPKQFAANYIWIAETISKDYN